MDHLLRLREQQDRSGGFITFIPLSYQTGTTKLVPRQTPPTDDLRTIAASRLLLDNFPHIEAYWVMIGEATASLALHFGASDVNGTLEDEKIAHMAQAREPGRPRHRADPPDGARRGQDPGGARRALQRRGAPNGPHTPALGASRRSLSSRSCSTRSATRRCSGKRLDRDGGALAADRGAAARGGRAGPGGALPRHPERVVTFVIDTNPNYTNVCITDCQFCAFYRKPGDKEA